MPRLDHVEIEPLVLVEIPGGRVFAPGVISDQVIAAVATSGDISTAALQAVLTAFSRSHHAVAQSQTAEQPEQAPRQAAS